MAWLACGFIPMTVLWVALSIPQIVLLLSPHCRSLNLMPGGGGWLQEKDKPKPQEFFIRKLWETLSLQTCWGQHFFSNFGFFGNHRRWLRLYRLDWTSADLAWVLLGHHSNGSAFTWHQQWPTSSRHIDSWAVSFITGYKKNHQWQENCSSHGIIRRVIFHRLIHPCPFIWGPVFPQRAYFLFPHGEFRGTVFMGSLSL